MKKGNYFKRFNALDRKYLYTDKHIHSTWTDGEGSILQISQRAQEIGLKTIAITDHIRETSTYFSQYEKEIKKNRKQMSLEILAGFEAKVKNFDGEIDAPKDVLKKAEIKIASVHRFPLGRKLYSPKEFDKKICQEIELELSIAAIKKGQANVLGHPGGMSIRRYNEFSLEFFEEIISECKKQDMAFDLDCSYHAVIYPDLKPILQKYNPLISLGSDAHKLSELGGWIEILKQDMNK